MVIIVFLLVTPWRVDTSTFPDGAILWVGIKISLQGLCISKPVFAVILRVRGQRARWICRGEQKNCNLGYTDLEASAAHLGEWATGSWIFGSAELETDLKGIDLYGGAEATGLGNMKEQHLV